MYMLSNNLCFVMQPFDNAVFDQRYEDIFEPALVAAGLAPYRVDQDPSVAIPIEEIEKRIRNSRICFAEITTNNPNVWYELGYAIACGKDVIMVSCTSGRDGKFPFDIQHRSILLYTTDSTSSFKKLEEQITVKASAFLEKQSKVAAIDPKLIETEGLTKKEIIILGVVMVGSIQYEARISLDEIQKEMNKHGFIDLASALAVTSLLNKGMIQEEIISESNGFGDYEYKAYRICPIGKQWLMENKDKLTLNISVKENLGEDSRFNDDALPF